VTWKGSESSVKGDGSSLANMRRTGKADDSSGEMAPRDASTTSDTDLSCSNRYLESIF
jgi:hypothetical protein